ncbi:MAG: BrnA antitoxin family protein [Gallionella sp.]
MPKLKTGTIIPSDDETAIINAGIAADQDNPELTKAWFAHAQPASAVFSPETFAALSAIKPARGRPKAVSPKVFTAIRLDADLLEAFKSTGSGWQTRINAALRQFVAEHPLSER